MSLELFSPCKVNLLLNTLGKRSDGFHELETVMQPVQFCDRVAFERGGPGIQLTCSDPGLPVDQGNLVYRAAAAFLAKAGITEGVRLHLEKRIPLAAGLGGGSGNAATALTGLNQLFGHPLPAKDLHDLAAGLGSDVPFFLQPNPALATGRGEAVQPLAPFPALKGKTLILIYPGFGVATAWAYQNLAKHPAALNGRSGRAAHLVERLQNPDLKTARSEFYNSLEAPVLVKYPLLAMFQDFLREHGAGVTLMSGSGSTTFAISESDNQARNLEAQLSQRFGPVWTAVVPL